MAADPIIYCLEHLTDYDEFERLCHDLMAAEGYAAIEPLGGTKDKGRDAIHISRHDSNDVTLFAYSVREDWRKKLEEDCEKISKYGHTCNHVAFLCTASFTPTERDNAVTFVKGTFGWQLDLYGLERLRILLGTVHPNVIANHPQIFCPPFFPRAGGLTVISSPDYLVIDHADPDEALATWLARRLTFEGYHVWCRSLAPVGGSSLSGTLETLVKHRAFRLLAILSPASLEDPDLSARRILALAIRPDLLLPIVAAPIDPGKLDAKTRSLEAISFHGDWATGLASLLDILVAGQCPRAPGGTGIALRSFAPPAVLAAEPETLYSNRFRILAIPEVIKRFTSARSLEDEALVSASLQWAFRRVDPRSFLAFHPPPQDLRDQLDIRAAGGAVWRDIPGIDGISTRNLVPELLRKSLETACSQRGLRYCTDRRTLYFQEGLLKGDRLYFSRPDGSKSFVSAVGRRTYWRPGTSTVYKYQLAPGFRVVRIAERSFSVLARIRLRFTDENGIILPPRTALSRRKHLCKDWWNDDWFNRILAVIQFLANGDRISLGEPSKDVIAIAITPDQWTVSVRINEAALQEDRAAIRDEAISYGTDREDEPDDE